MTVLIYLLVKDGLVCYVGQTRRRANRLKEHKARFGDVSMFEIETVSGHRADETERFYISLFRALGARLANVSDGAEVKFTAEVRRKIAEGAKRFWTGRKQSPEHARKVRDWVIANHPLRGKSHAGGPKISATMKGRRLKPETIQKLKARRFSVEHRAALSKAMKGNRNGVRDV